MRRIDARLGERREHVVDRLAGDRTELGAHRGVDLVGGAVGALGHRDEHGHPLRRDAHTLLPQEIGGFGRWSDAAHRHDTPDLD